MKLLIMLTWILILILLILFAPIFTLVAINTLFSTTIPYTFCTWCASFWLTSVFAGTKYIKRK